MKIEKIYLDSAVEASPYAHKILSRLPDVPVERIHDREAFTNWAQSLTLSEGKRAIWLSEFPGDFLKPCPGTHQDYLCCNYWVINAQVNCPLDCSYCVLQGYLNFPLLTIYCNIETIAERIDALARAHPQRLFRIGTGELTDSLALDAITEFNERLIRGVNAPNVILEFKTKTAQIEHLPSVEGGKMMLSWSVNPLAVIQKQEHKTDSLEKRLSSARRAIEKGYRLGFHFDPILEVANWESAYETLLKELTQAVQEKDIYWISLGSLRFPAASKTVMESRFPQSGIFSAGEFIRGSDGKLRYPRTIRTDIYKKIMNSLRGAWPDVFVYFCMENQTVWNQVMGWAPENNEHLEYLFHENLERRFPGIGLPQARRGEYETKTLEQLTGQI